MDAGAFGIGSFVYIALHVKEPMLIVLEINATYC